MMNIGKYKSKQGKLSSGLKRGLEIAWERAWLMTAESWVVISYLIAPSLPSQTQSYLGPRAWTLYIGHTGGHMTSTWISGFIKVIMTLISHVVTI